ncbi:MAG: hypothetical protein KKG93_12785 [Bacteroidetes bacterium]|nr:hypothetical protein [Bacteroidota bacterium]
MKKKNSIENIKADYRLLVDIQMGKYLRSVGRSEFISDTEAQYVISIIIAAYNDVIASNHERLDNSDLEDKTAWFNSVEIDI